MKQTIRTLALMAILLTAVGLMLSLVAGKAIAQIRAALVKNVDEPGRMPYQQMVEFHTSDCFGPCIITFNPVPAGKRLVVEHVTMLIGVAAGGQFQVFAFGDLNYVNIGNQAIIKPDFALGPATAGGNFWSIDRPVRVYFEAGATPKLKVGASAFASGGLINNASLHGYLIDAN